MKNIEYPNRGHLLSDYFIDGISRVYEHEGNIIMTLESPTGIETPNSILKNECLRLVIPKSKFNIFHKSILDIKKHLLVEDTREEESIQTTKKDDTFLGSAFNVSD
jgi:hypothetical protein